MSGYDLFILPRIVLNLFLTICSVLLLSNSLAIFDHFLPFSISKPINLLSSTKFHSPLYKIKNTDSWMDLSDSTISICIVFLISSTIRWIANKVALLFRSICLWVTIHFLITINILHYLFKYIFFLKTPCFLGFYFWNQFLSLVF